MKTGIIIASLFFIATGFWGIGDIFGKHQGIGPMDPPAGVNCPKCNWLVSKFSKKKKKLTCRNCGEKFEA